VSSRAQLVACALVSVLAAGSSRVARAERGWTGDDWTTQGWKNDRAFFEWSTWVRLSYGVARVEEPRDLDAAARTITPPSATYDQVGGGEAALGADFMLPVPTKHVRLGPWLEVRGLTDVIGGVELQIARSPRSLPWFYYDGEGVWSVRAGANTTHATVAVAWGYRCPWVMYSDAPKGTRYMIGGRIVASFTRELDNPNVWSGSLGIEFEPVGTLRYLLGIQSWY
jgi:hypothetical protein